MADEVFVVVPDRNISPEKEELLRRIEAEKIKRLLARRRERLGEA